MLGVFVLNITNTNPRYGKEKSKSGEDVSVEQRGQLFRLLDRYVECFNTDVESTLNHGVEHHTDTGGARPILTNFDSPWRPRKDRVRNGGRIISISSNTVRPWQFASHIREIRSQVLRHLKWTHSLFVYQDDITIFADSFESPREVRSSVGGATARRIKVKSGKLQVSCDLFCFLSFSRNLSLG